MIPGDKFEGTRALIDILPGEILAEILAFATNLNNDKQLRYRFPSILCQVSRTWRAATLDAPRVWSFIYVPDVHALEFAQARIDKTGTVPLEIEVVDPNSQLLPSNLMNILLPTSNRWATLNFHVHNLKDYADHLPATLPKLGQIYFKDYGSDFTFDTSFPQLKYIEIDTAGVCWGPTALLSNLTEFHSLEGAGGVIIPVEKLLDFLHITPNLEVLELHNMWDLESIDDEQYLSLQKHPVHLPRLLELRLDGVYSWEFALLVSLLRAPAVETLMLAIFARENHQAPSLGINKLLHINFPLAKTLILRDLSILPADIKHILCQMPPIRELSIIKSSETDMEEVFGMIISDPSLTNLTSRLSEVSIKGIKIFTLGPHLYPSSLSPTSISLLGRLNLRIQSDDLYVHLGVEDDQRQHDEVLHRLRTLIPKVESTDNEPWWNRVDT